MISFRHVLVGLILVGGVAIAGRDRAEAGAPVGVNVVPGPRVPCGNVNKGCYPGFRYPCYPYYGSYLSPYPLYYGAGFGYSVGYGDPLGYYPPGYGYPPLDPNITNQSGVPPLPDANLYPQPQRYGDRMIMPPPGEQAPMPRGDTAEVIVNVPDDAEVWIEGAKMKQTGGRRRFTSPSLVPGHSYAYEIRASWTENGRKVSDSKSITIHAGDRSSLTFIGRPNRADNAVSKAEK